MSDISYGQTVDMLKNAMAGAGEAHSVIANNVANANTPQFHRSDVSFKEALAATEARTDTGDELQMVITSDRHINAGPETEAQPFAISTTVDSTTQMRVDGSNVDLDQEMAKLSINSSYAQTMQQLLGNQYMRIRESIAEHV